MFQTRKSAAASSSSSDIRRDDNEDTSESSSVTNDDDITMCEELFNIIMTATSDDGRPLHPAFQLLPSKKVWKYFIKKTNNLFHWNSSLV